MEDIGIISTLPGFRILAPCDSIELKSQLKESFSHEGPTYIRIGKKGEPNIHKGIPEFKIGCSIFLEKGKDLSLISVGNVLGLANECWEGLRKENLNSNLISMHTIKPLDEELLEKLFTNNQLIVLIEEHSLIGGAGTAILEWANKKNYETIKIIRFAGPDKFLTGYGDQYDARQ